MNYWTKLHFMLIKYFVFDMILLSFTIIHNVTLNKNSIRENMVRSILLIRQLIEIER